MENQLTLLVNEKNFTRYFRVKEVKRMQFKNRKAFFTLLFSNSLILCLVISISALTFLEITQLYEEEIKKYYNVEAQMDKMVIDSALKNIDEMFYELTSNETVIKISRYRAPLSRAEYLSAAQGYKDFALLKFNYMIEDMYIVFPHTDLVVRNSGCNTMRDYYDIYLSEKFKDYETFKEIIEGGEKKKFLLSDNGKDVFCVNTILPTSNDERVVVVVIDLNENLLFPYQNGESDTRFLIYEKTPTELFRIIGFENEEFDIEEALRTSAYKTGEKEYYVTSVDSEQSSWKYVYLINTSKLTARMAGIRFFLTIGIILTVVLGTIALLFLTKKQYAPIKKIVSSISKNFGENPSHMNEYEYIGSIVEKFGREFKPENVMKREKNAKQLALLKLMRGEENNEASQKIIEESLLKKNYMVAIFAVEDAGELFFEETEKKDNESLARLILGNVLGEILSAQFDVEMCEADNIIFIIGSDDENRQDEIYNLLCEGQDLIEKNFNLSFSAMLSPFHSGIEELSLCYKEARECFSYRIFSNRGIVRYSEIDGFGFDIGYSYTTEQEKSLSGYLKNFNSEAAKNLIDEMLELDANGEKRSPISFRCMIYDIIGTVVKTIYDMGVDGEEFLKLINIFENVEKCNNASQIRELLIQVIDDCCSFISGKNEKTDKKIVEHIKAFIALNYGDPNLSVSMIAQRFDRNANYLSTLFKKETATPLSGYITEVRIEKAKEILKNEHLKLEKVAHMCGYESIRTFSRVFNNQVGTTPGKYRETL